MWMTALVTRRRYDGTWPNVGMNDRTVIGPYRTIATINKHALNWGNGERLRVEIFIGTNIRTHGDAYKFYYLNYKPDDDYEPPM